MLVQPSFCVKQALARGIGMLAINCQYSFSSVMRHILLFWFDLSPTSLYLSFCTSSVVALCDSTSVLSNRMMHYNRKSLWVFLTVAKYFFDVFWHEQIKKNNFTLNCSVGCSSKTVFCSKLSKAWSFYLKKSSINVFVLP